MSVETYLANLVSLTCPSLPILAKLKRRYLQFPDFWSTLMKENCHNSRTSNDIDMKLGPVAKLNKINKTTSKKCGDDAMLTKYDVIVIFVILASLEQPTSRSPDA